MIRLYPLAVLQAVRDIVGALLDLALGTADDAFGGGGHR
jgi:hypothetical protein